MLFNFKKKKRRIIINNEELKADHTADDHIEIKKEYITNILSSRKLPIVLLDPLWHTAKERIKSKEIDKNEKELQELLKEQARLTTDFKEYTVVKQNFLKQILDISNRVQESNDQGPLDELNCLHQSTLVTNNKLHEIEDRLSAIDGEIQDKNNELISEMVAIGYNFIEEYKSEAMALDREIETLRAEMLRKTNKKKEDEAFLKDIYHYLHSIVGREHIEIMDKVLGDINIQEKE